MKGLLSILRRTAAVGLVASAAAAAPRTPALSQAEPHPFTLSGLVVDASGAPVSGATVTVEPSTAGPVPLKTGPDGKFAVNAVPPGPAIVTAGAPGFDTVSVHVQVAPGATSVRLVLRPAPLSETVAVTASRGASALESPPSASVLTSADLAGAAAGTVDDALRSTPGFSLFRRSSSRVTNPTAQGVTLRGISGLAPVARWCWRTACR